jgi:outer membrane protein OmpA-like peptidoglycan-associated protein
VLKIRKNYVNAVKKIGGIVLSEGSRTYMRGPKEGKETWIELNLATTTTGDNYSLTVVEKTAMEQEVAAHARPMATDIKETGHVAIYGIYFDHDSYHMEPESAPTLKAIAEMFKTNSMLNICVVGHTDMTGELEYNMRLSSERAQAVVDALVNEYGIPSNRLKAKGVGPLSPVSTNRTEEGKRLNRRVELVKMGSFGSGQVRTKSPEERQVSSIVGSEFTALLDAANTSYSEGIKIETVDKLKMAVRSVWDEVPLTVRHVRLVSDPKNYTSKKNNIYGKDEPIYITSQIFGHKLKEVGDGYKTSITTDFLVLDDAGNVLGGQQDVYKFDHISPIPVTDFSLDLTYTLTGAPEGTYNLQTTVNDKNSGKTTKFETMIEIR